MSETMTLISGKRAAGLTLMVALGVMSFASVSVSAQLGPGDPRKIYPGAEIAARPKPPLNPHSTQGVRFIPGGGYGYGGGTTIIIVNGQPCYAPAYYGGYVGGFYGNAYQGVGGYSVGFNVGGLSLGYRQNTGYSYNNYVAVPPPVSYDNSYNNTNSNNYVRNEVRSLPRQDSSQATDDQAPYSSRKTAPPIKPNEDDANTYYLNRKPSPLQKDPTLAQAVRDIENAFRTGNSALIERHLDASEKLTLMSQGRTRRQLEVPTYLDMTKDALQNIKTVSYTLDKVEPASGGAWMAYGKHVMTGENGANLTFNVGFVLKKKTDKDVDKWIITEVSADPAK